MDIALYNARILRLAASIPHQGRLAEAQATARRTSPICGSRVTADVAVDAGGRVAAFGQEVRACALGQAAAAILGQGVVGRTGAELSAAADALQAWLRERDTPLPDRLAADWPDLLLFDPARAHPARHASIALAFEAAAEAATAAARARAA